MMKRMSPRTANSALRWSFFVGVLPFLLLVASTRIAGGVVRDTFETAETAWKVVHADSPVRVLGQKRVFGDARSGNGCEALSISAGVGTFVHAAYEIPPGQVITEFSPSLWVRADRPGIQLLARVVLPRSLDEKTGQPLTRLIYGDSYTTTGLWQKLQVRRADELVARLEPILRSQFGPSVDVREAYVDMVVLNAYGGQGVTNLWIDDLEVTGHVAVPESTLKNSTTRPSEPTENVRAVGFESSETNTKDVVNLNGTVLEVGGRPFFSRAVEYQGESFETIKSLGFNTVWLADPATREQLEAARDFDLKIVAPPPRVGGGSIGPIHDVVIAWNLGERLGLRDLIATRETADALRRLDPLRRPIICAPDSHARGLSRVADIVLFENVMIGGSFELSNYGEWLQERSRLARPGVPFWATVQTELPGPISDQIAVLTGGAAPKVFPQPSQIRLIAYNAVGSGARGLLVRAETRLDGGSDAAKLRAAALKKINLELQIIEPWISAGKYEGKIDTGTNRIRATALETERARLLIATRATPGQQWTPAAAPTSALTLIDPGSPSEASAFHVSGAGLLPLYGGRRSGGVRANVRDFGDVGLVVFSQDPLTPSHLSRSIAATQSEVAQLRQQIASGELAQVEAVHRQLSTLGVGQPSAEDHLRTARASLRQCDTLLAGRDYRASVQFAGRAENAIDRIRRGYWNAAVEAFPSPVASPLCATYATLPYHWMMSGQMKDARWGANLLPGGDFEDLYALTQTGWKHQRYAESGLNTSIELSTKQYRSGKSSVRMLAWADDPKTAPAVVESAPVWITSAPINVAAGQVVRIHGWAFLPRAVVGSFDQLLIFDSIAGPSLAARIDEPGEWREFTFYRKALTAEPLVVTFALTGIGEVLLDDVTIEPIELGQAIEPPPLPGAPPVEQAIDNRWRLFQR